MPDPESVTLEVTLLTDEGAPEQLFELRTDQLRFLVAVDFEVEDGIAYEIFNAPLYEDHHGLMHEIVQSWLHTVGTLSLSELMQDDD